MPSSRRLSKGEKAQDAAQRSSPMAASRKRRVSEELISSFAEELELRDERFAKMMRDIDPDHAVHLHHEEEEQERRRKQAFEAAKQLAEKKNYDGPPVVEETEETRKLAELEKDSTP